MVKIKSIHVIVSTSRETRERPVLIRGKDLSIIDTSREVASMSNQPCKLVIRDKGQKGKDGKPLQLAVFQTWQYWRVTKMTKDKKADGDELCGHYTTDIGIMIPVYRRFLNEHLDILKSRNFNDLTRYKAD